MLYWLIPVVGFSWIILKFTFLDAKLDEILRIVVEIQLNIWNDRKATMTDEIMAESLSSEDESKENDNPSISTKKDL